MKWKWILAATAIACTAGAQMTSMSDGFMKAMDVSMVKMDKGMADAPMDGTADHDFATMMLAHHQGAIDMAKAELSYGKDPVMRRLAQEILVDQQSEMDAMNLWLKKRP